MGWKEGKEGEKPVIKKNSKSEDGVKKERKMEGYKINEDSPRGLRDQGVNWRARV